MNKNDILQQTTDDRVDAFIRGTMTEEEEDIFINKQGYDRYEWLDRNMFDYRGLIPRELALEVPEGMYELELLNYWLPSQNESDSVTDNTTQITVGCKIRSKTNPDVILRIVSDDCHGDKFECSNGSVLSLKQINKHYDLYIEENNGPIVIN